MNTFLFYDIETSGLNPAFDQVLTFASIRTDLELNEIERETITIKLRKDIVPSPGAFLTHGLTFDELSEGICEYEAAKKIHSVVNTPGTISLGYNSLGFDDEFLRFLFYRNLLDPYVHQYGNGCSRMDMLPIAVIFKVFHPQGIKWPTVDGKSSLKLEWISKENKFETSGRAHEAMSDVEALIGLSKKLKQNKKIWDYCLDFFNKTRDEVRVNSIETNCDIGPDQYPLCLMASAAFGSDANYLAPVIPIGQSSAYKNQSLWLRLDTDNILGIEASEKLEDTFVVRKRYGDLPVVLPALERFWNKLPDSSRKLVTKNTEIVTNNMTRFKAYINYHCAFKYPFVPNIDSDSALYQTGFFSAQEKRESEQFHTALSNKDHTAVNQIQSPRIKKLALRILNRNFKVQYQYIADPDFAYHLKCLGSDQDSDQIFGYKGDLKYDRCMALEELATFKSKITQMDVEAKKMMDWLGSYIKERF